ncbi:MAG: bifunctional oligoribonuclease/PAP phosphatase NrnA [Planctomycetota bacterium]
MTDCRPQQPDRPALPAGLVSALRKCRRPTVFAHVNPDGDAVGSELAMAYGFRSLGAAPRVLAATSVADRFGFLDPGGLIEVVPEGESTDAIGQADLILILDTSEPARIGHFQAEAWARPVPRCVVDHHLCEAPEVFDEAWIDTCSPSTGNLILNLLDALQVPLTPEIADALFVAVASDTGWFRYGNSTPEAFAAAERCVAAGANPERLHRLLYETSSPGRTRLLGQLLARLCLAGADRVVYGVLTHEMVAASGVGLAEIDGFVDVLRTVKGAEIVFLAVEVSPGHFKVSLRSRGRLSIHPIAVRFGGGGHAQAAGCRLRGTESEVVAEILAAARQVLGDVGKGHLA